MRHLFVDESRYPHIYFLIEPVVEVNRDSAHPQSMTMANHPVIGHRNRYSADSYFYMRGYFFFAPHEIIDSFYEAKGETV